MVDESTDILFTKEEIKPSKGNLRRFSTGIVIRNSTKELSSPNYLRASTGSCHEFCKYGGEHSFAVKARNHIPKIIIPPSDKQKNTRTQVLAEKKKASSLKLKPLPDIEVHLPENNIGTVDVAERKKTPGVKLKPSSDFTLSSELPEVIKREISLPFKKIEVYSKQDSSNTKIMKDNEMKKPCFSKHSSVPKSNSVTVRSSSSFTPSLNSTRKTTIKTGKVTGTSNGKIMGTATKTRKVTGTSNRKIMGISKTAVNKVLGPSTASLPPKPSSSRVLSLYGRKYSGLKPVSLIKDQKRTRKAESKKPDSDKVQEKTLHVVEEENENKILEFFQSDVILQTSAAPSLLEESECIRLQLPEYSNRENLEGSGYGENESDEFISENDEIVIINKVHISKGYQDKDSAVTNSKFTRGRIVDLQSNTNVTRKLKYRQGRVFGSNDNGMSYARMRSFKKGKFGDDDNDGSPSSKNVILKHQDTQGGKDAQGLFNNIIEEIASKLVESKKTKVKALVGAFETVISLQESKPRKKSNESCR